MNFIVNGYLIFIFYDKERMQYHKLGYYKIPTNKDYNGQIITNPESCNLEIKNLKNATV